jgi:hypothetical protein
LHAARASRDCRGNPSQNRNISDAAFAARSIDDEQLTQEKVGEGVDLLPRDHPENLCGDTVEARGNAAASRLSRLQA